MRNHVLFSIIGILLVFTVLGCNALFDAYNDAVAWVDGLIMGTGNVITNAGDATAELERLYRQAINSGDLESFYNGLVAEVNNHPERRDQIIEMLNQANMQVPGLNSQ